MSDARDVIDEIIATWLAEDWDDHDKGAPHYHGAKRLRARFASAGLKMAWLHQVGQPVRREVSKVKPRIALVKAGDVVDIMRAAFHAGFFAGAITPCPNLGVKFDEWAEVAFQEYLKNEASDDEG